MITLDKLKYYLKFDGDQDMLARATSNKKTLPLSRDEWALISNLLQEAHLIITNNASEKYRKEIEDKIENSISKEALALFYDSAR